jgi:hypothetical protein
MIADIIVKRDKWSMMEKNNDLEADEINVSPSSENDSFAREGRLDSYISKSMRNALLESHEI